MFGRAGPDVTVCVGAGPGCLAGPACLAGPGLARHSNTCYMSYMRPCDLYALYEHYMSASGQAAFGRV